jgi:4-diphosphocytidyl-2-C-methyl-D-erythritol kinase
MVTFPNAKINLGLYVTERRPDGFHNLETLFYPVRLTDALEILPSGEFSFHSSGIGMDGEIENNLVVKAYRLLKKEFQLPAVKIYLHKVIPTGAGLGGGSSDAAFTLKMINTIFNTGLSQLQLENYAGMLGADCPFFIRNIPSLATGKGDQLTPLEVDLSPYHLVIVKPPVSVNTALAYQGIVPKNPETPLDNIINKPIESWQNSLFNDFETNVFKQFPQIGAIKQTLYDLGANYASMSGSGSAVFALFRQLPQNLKQLFPDSYYVFILV